MSVQKYVSQIKQIPYNQETVYDRLSNMEILKYLYSPENLERAQAAMGEKAKDIQLEDFTADRDSCSFKINPIGQVGLRVIEREEAKTIKITGDGDGALPFALTLWIQILPATDQTSKMRITIHADLNMMLKMMLGKKLEGGVDQMADGLSKIPFGNIPSMNA